MQILFEEFLNWAPNSTFLTIPMGGGTGERGHTRAQEMLKGPRGSVDSLCAHLENTAVATGFASWTHHVYS